MVTLRDAAKLRTPSPPVALSPAFVRMAAATTSPHILSSAPKPRLLRRGGSPFGTNAPGLNWTHANRQKGLSMTSATPTIDHTEIRRWAEKNNARPACVKGTGKDNDPGILRLD